MAAFLYQVNHIYSVMLISHHVPVCHLALINAREGEIT